jgi:hypothetical protein
MKHAMRNHRDHVDTARASTEALKIILPSAERKPCVCGATLFRTNITRPNHPPIWLCSRHCGARGASYEGALRRKVRLDLLSWGDLKRNAETLIEAENSEALATAIH